MAITVPQIGTEIDVVSFGKPVVDQLNALVPTAWTALALTNGWANTTLQVAQYRKIGDIVYLRGMISAPAASANTVIATLPANFRIPAQMEIACPYWTGAQRAVAAIAVQTTGGLFCNDSVPSGMVMSLGQAFYSVSI